MQYSELSPAIRKILETLPDSGGHAASAPMLPRECYTSPEFFEFERLAVFPRSWVCVGREEQIPNIGDYLAPTIGVEPLLVVRRTDGSIGAMSAICRHRGLVIATEAGSAGRAFRCPLHVWTYDLDGNFVGAPYLESHDDMECLRKNAKLPEVRLERWHGFLFVNLDPEAPPLAPSLAKVEPFWANYENADLVAVPPTPGDKPLPWNWKIHAENFTDAYHPEFVHRGTHDFAPSVHAEGGVEFTAMTGADNAIVRTVPLLQADGGMTDTGWGPEAAFPAIESLAPEQRKRLTFVLIPPSMTLIFAPGAVAYQLITPVGAEATLASNDRVTAGGWLLPRSTRERNDFAERAATVREGAKKIWLQDIPVNLGIQAGKKSRFTPDGHYVPLEKTLVQFNAWLLRAYRAAAPSP
ncbi:MAG: aromatic ring-hydroxylating dioxygenase subunit alpha [Reyranella sp.]|nr:aromatic ring-hydroxylating dioxygenase subunit alpha [Reyranella sp.]